MPTNTSQWEASFHWGVFFDGKDATKGPHVYDWDKKFFFKVSDLLTNVYADEQTEAGREELSLDLVERFRKATYQNLDYNEKCMAMVCETEHSISAGGFKPFGGFGNSQPGVGACRRKKVPSSKASKYADVECVNKAGGNEIMPRCTDEMECSDVQALLTNIPSYLYTYNELKTKNPICPKGLRAEIPQGDTKKQVLRRLISNYNDALHSALAGGFAREQVFNALMKFTRSFAFLHPFENGNGRLRNMLLQRELRRLGLACGTMMFNYNKDAFVDGHERYSAKVKEGIEWFDWAIQNQKNPWLDNSTVAAHQEKFETLNGLEKCAARGKFGSGGTINLDTVHHRPEAAANETDEQREEREEREDAELVQMHEDMPLHLADIS